MSGKIFNEQKAKNRAKGGGEVSRLLAGIEEISPKREIAKDYFLF